MRNKIVSRLQGIDVPRDITMEESEDKNTLFLTMQYKGVTEDMQKDYAAFEAWALLGKAKGYSNVILGIENIYEIKEGLGHYNRFLYRVICFDELFDWFSISEELGERVQEFKNKYFSGIKLIYNVPCDESKKSNKDKILESDMEEFFVTHKDITNKKLGINAEEYFAQLPVGLFEEVKSKDSRIFTGGRSNLDFWALTDDTLNIIELKAGLDNYGLGVLSELFFYTCIMRDRHINKLAEESNRTDVRGFNKILNTKIKLIKAFILVEKKHKNLEISYEELKKVSEKDNKIKFADSIITYSKSEFGLE